MIDENLFNRGHYQSQELLEMDLNVSEKVFERIQYMTSNFHNQSILKGIANACAQK